MVVQRRGGKVATKAEYGFMRPTQVVRVRSHHHHQQQHHPHRDTVVYCVFDHQNARKFSISIDHVIFPSFATLQTEATQPKTKHRLLLSLYYYSKHLQLFASKNFKLCYSCFFSSRFTPKKSLAERTIRLDWFSFPTRVL